MSSVLSFIAIRISLDVDEQKECQQEHLKKPENLSFDDVDGNVKQEFHKGSRNGTIKQKSYFDLCKC